MLTLIATLILILGQVFRYPEAVREVISGSFVPGVGLAYPWQYTLFAPFLHLSDHLTILSLNQHIAFVLTLNAVWIFSLVRQSKKEGYRFPSIFRGVFLFVLYNFLLALFAAAVVLVHRPMASLTVLDPDALIYDSHSHTSFSWDGRKAFTPEKNLEWHHEAGFHAAFITDHNRVDGVSRAKINFDAQGRQGTIPLSGEEVSLQNCHLAVIGNAYEISNSTYDGSIPGTHKFLSVMKSSHALVIASLPEYWFYQWKTKPFFINWGIHGFELINSPPVSMDFPPSMRSEILALCREKHLIMTGVTDNHGWGSTVYVWNVTRLPGWRALSREKLDTVLIEHLRKEKDNANQIFVRVKAEPKDNLLWLAVDPLRQFWEAARSLPLSHCASILVWIWIPWFIKRNKKS